MRVLIVEDSDTEAEMMKKALGRDPSVDIDIASSLARARDALGRAKYDLVILDNRLPDGEGLGLLEELVERKAGPAVIMVTGRGDEKTAATAFRIGALDYVVKDDTLAEMLPAAVDRVINEVKVNRAVARARESARRFEDIASNAREWIWEVDEDGVYTYASPVVEKILGYPVGEVLGKHFYDFFCPDQLDELKYEASKVIQRREPFSDFLNCNLDRSGEKVWLLTSGVPVFNDEGDFTGYRGLDSDITELIHAEEAVRESEALYRKLVEESPDTVAFVDLKGKILKISRGVLDLMRVDSPDEIEGRSVFDFMVPEQRELAKENARKRRFEELPTSIEYEFQRMDGTTFTGAVRSSLIRDADGNPEHYVYTLRDTTERRNAEEALRASEERFRELADSLPEVVFEMDSDGYLTFVNRNAFEATGYGRDELERGINAVDMLAEQDRERGSRNIEQLLNGEAHAGNEYLMKRKDGTVFPAMLSTAPIYKDGLVVGARGIMTDITESREAQEELRRINAELEGFAHTVSHDLRGPLATVLGANMTIQNMMKAPDLNEFREDLLEVTEIMDRSVRKSELLINDLLSLAEAGQQPEEVTDVDVGRVVSEVMEDHAGEIETGAVEVEIDEEMGSIKANRTHLYQVFSNLIGNAIEHNAAEKPVVRVTYLGQEGKDGHRYLVCDNGQGIPEEIMEEVLLPFSKGSGGGFGVGLSIVDKIVRAYGGEIRAYNEEGACFEFLLRDS